MAAYLIFRIHVVIDTVAGHVVTIRSVIVVK